MLGYSIPCNISFSYLILKKALVAIMGNVLAARCLQIRAPLLGCYHTHNFNCYNFSEVDTVKTVIPSLQQDKVTMDMKIYFFLIGVCIAKFPNLG